MNNPIKSIRSEVLVSGFTQTPRGYSTGWRQLPCTMLSYVHVPGMEGTGEPAALLQRHGCGDLVVPAGSLLFVPAREIHLIETVGEGVFSLWMHFSVQCGPGIDWSELYNFPRIYPRQDRKGLIVEQLKMIFQQNNSENYGDELCAAFFSAAVAAELLTCATQRRMPGMDKLRRISPAIKRIRSTPEKRFSAEELAGECFLSESRFRAVFREVMGQTAHEFAENERIQLAVRYLQQGSSLDEIAAKLAYCDTAHFSRTFRKMTGQPPGIFRKKYF